MSTKHVIEECGSCGAYHRVGFDGDCRNDSERFAGIEDYIERNGVSEDRIAVRTFLSELDTFTRAYIECALWVSFDDGDAPLDDSYSIDDLAPETLDRIIADCAKFQDRMRTVLDAVQETGQHGNTYAMAGHDFWLTRNHHGAGFWDGDWDIKIPEASGEAGKVLTNTAHAFGECYLYVGDDGQLYLEGGKS